MLTVLIVDDQDGPRSDVVAALRSYTQDVDKNHEWSFLEAGDSAQALSLIRTGVDDHSKRIDILLADRQFPGDNDGGIRLIEDARKADVGLIGILYSGQEGLTEEVRTKALERGAFDVVKREGSSPKQLILKFHSAMRHRELEQQLGFLRRYFDPRVYDRIQKEPDLLGPRQQLVTIGFWDIRKFSRLCESLIATPESIFGFLNEYCDRAARVIFQHNGVLDKFIGDGIMALFGVLQDKGDDGESDALDAVKAAVALRKQFDEIVVKWKPRWKKDTGEALPAEFGLGCGLHTAKVIVGSVGTEFRDQFTALGRDVNRANRVEMRSKAGQVLLSQTTEGRVNGRVITTEIGEIAGKPGEASMVAYEVDGFKD